MQCGDVSFALGIVQVPALDALKQVEGSMLSDDAALAEAMAKA